MNRNTTLLASCRPLCSFSRSLALSLLSIVGLASASTLVAIPAAAQRSVPVTVDSSDANPVRVRQSIQPINADVQIAMATGLINSSNQTLYSVPSDARLVIETYSIWSFTTSCSQYLQPSLTTTAGGHPSEFKFEVPSRAYFPSGGYYTHQMTQPVRVYADPGTTVYAKAIRTGTDCTTTLRVSISGHLVPID